MSCDAFKRHLAEVDRRSFLRSGMLGTAGLALSDVLRAEAAAPARRTSSVIILWMRGGPSHIDLWDLKPDAPIEFRGEFSPIRTKVPGVHISEHLPLSAKIMDKWSIVRSLHHSTRYGMADHSSGDQICFTGYGAAPDPAHNIHPSVGSVVAEQLQEANPRLPAYVMVPRMVPGTDASYLGAAYRPFETMADPGEGRPFSVPNLAMPEGVGVGQLRDRASLLDSLDRLERTLDKSGAMDAMDKFHRRAMEIVTGPEARRAFDLESEPRGVRERYGFFEPYTPRMRAAGDRPQWSQRMLLARRLVEAGVRLVTVDCRWWDTHEDNFHALKNAFLPMWDRAYSALIEDLDQRGLLESTLVVAWGEMGRSPRISENAGRDHWPHAMAAAIAGGGVVGGRVVGATDDKGMVPKENAKVPQDVLATIYRHLGVDYTKNYLDHQGRPHPVLPEGSPIAELF
jgi:uncharacterized protein (DUF1501 family)